MLVTILAAALISFFSISLLMNAYLEPVTRYKVAGQWAGRIDLLIHGTVILMFMGTSTLGLIQAELAAIIWTLYNRYFYRWFRGASYKNSRNKWYFVPGVRPIDREGA